MTGLSSFHVITHEHGMGGDMQKEICRALACLVVQLKTTVSYEISGLTLRRSKLYPRAGLHTTHPTEQRSPPSKV